MRRQGAHLPLRWGSIRASVNSIVLEPGEHDERVTEYAAEVAGSERRGFDRIAAAVLADALRVAESSRDVSDPTSGPRTLTPGPVTGSLTSRLRVRDRAMV